ncbi:MAG TPA: hypothetical protein VNN62_08055, partial [Methylomirabilota bacterium]|nr:hypothetical protein [Methylomirabilota bacterium]
MQKYHIFPRVWKITVAILLSLLVASPGPADVQPGEVVTKETMDKAEGLLIPTMKWFVQHGLTIPVTPYR